ncbi:MAG: TlpA family protein disulfide reductase [Bacteroidales bacterium]|nr:TlpA family protein disulfide reductase [Bacteroidales bacterium]MCF6342734.1 TlpA family protein disulfide reductase [Bacteroidales bacterium]
MKKTLLSVVVLVLLVSGFTMYQAEDADENRGYLVKAGDMAPDFRMEFTDGKTVSLKELRGKVVVLQFTASWCSVCRKEMPHLEKEVWLPNKDKDFILIGIDYDEPLEKVVAFQKQMEVTYPMALDPGAEIFAKFAHKKSGVTRNVVIDRNGQIVFLTRLYDRSEFEAMKKKIDELLR